MLYTEDFTMRHYVGFSQIGSHILLLLTHMLQPTTGCSYATCQLFSIIGVRSL